MLYTDFTQEMLGLQDVIVSKVENTEKELVIYAELKRKEHDCIRCGNAGVQQRSGMAYRFTGSYIGFTKQLFSILSR